MVQQGQFQIAHGSRSHPTGPCLDDTELPYLLLCPEDQRHRQHYARRRLKTDSPLRPDVSETFGNKFPAEKSLADAQPSFRLQTEAGFHDA